MGRPHVTFRYYCAKQIQRKILRILFKIAVNYLKTNLTAAAASALPGNSPAHP
jgi:hypothetical protein